MPVQKIKHFSLEDLNHFKNSLMVLLGERHILSILETENT